jgi:hypothetical protein
MLEALVRPEAKLTRGIRASDLRRHQRVKVALLGRYMLSDRREFPCQTVDMSPGGVRLTGAEPGLIDERVVLYLEEIGRLEGAIARLIPEGFAVRLNATPRKREKIASQLTWLANRESLGLPEGRTHERLKPVVSSTTLRIDAGREIPARIIDVSMSGVALSASIVPALGSSVLVGRTPGRVVRHFDGGVGVNFLLPISPDLFHEGLRL